MPTRNAEARQGAMQRVPQRLRPVVDSEPFDLEEYGGLRLDQAKRLKQLERENVRLKRVVAEQALDLAILKEAAEGHL